MLQERWPLWKAGLYVLEVTSLQVVFQTSGLAYDNVLGFVSYLTYIYYALYPSHILSVSISYSNRGFLIFSSFLPYCFLKNTFLSSHSL